MHARRSILSLSLLLFIGWGSSDALAVSSPSSSAAVEFDTQTLIARGYSADIAKFFSGDSRFLPGRQEVTIALNAHQTYTTNVQFDDDGDPCFDAALLGTLRLRKPSDLAGCVDPEQMWPEFHMKLHPGQFRIDMTVPEKAFDPKRRDDGLHSGGKAMLLNYDVFAQRFDTRFGNSHYFQARIEPGFNIGNWSFRNRGSLTNSSNGFSYQLQDTYLARTVDAWGAIAQIGQFTSAGESLGGLPMLGVQIGSDSLQSGGQLTVPIQGIAESNATVEVRQRGRVVYRTIVPPGPFMLSDIGNVAQNADLQIEITEQDGRKRRFEMPVGMSYADAKQPMTWQAAIGRYQDAGHSDGRRTPAIFATGEVSFSAFNNLRVSTAALAAPGYVHASAQGTLSVESGAWLASGVRYSRAAGVGQGYQFELQGSTRIGGNVFASASWLSRSNRYTTPDVALGSLRDATGAGQTKHSANASVNWAHPRWGSFTYGLSYNSFFGASSTLSHTLSIGRKIGRANVSLAAQISPKYGSSVYANVSIPLGGGSLSARSARSQRGDLTFGTSYSNRLGRNGSYSIGASGDKNGQTANASFSMNTGLAQIGAGVAQSTTNSRSTYVSVSGGIAYANGLFGTASSRIGDTFAIVSVPNQKGLRISAPGGTSITNPLGTAIIPSVTPYTKAQLRLDTQSLPMNVRLDTTTVDIGLRRGSVLTRTINATETRQLMLTIRDSTGATAPVGTTVLDEQGQFLGTIVGDGNFILSDDDIGKPIRLSGVNRSECRVTYDAPELFDPDQPYEEAEGSCG
ncbi:fimbrial protein [Burkholderia savannae]|uniref:Fimbrial protein n=1 Tax=Burkholderia savannae TaxID=1637837 RepID=A0ABR5T2A3_9BURK|nr:fimbria/pilus outer membrane usher protein [Burkholderia savannae]KWZ37319.1 fimbrial protein [Burkholderia savannae]